MASDQTPETPTPKGWLAKLRASKMPGLMAAGLVIAAFGGGVLSAKGVDWLGKPAAETAAAPGAQGWSLFGKPRDAKAARRGIPKPEGFGSGATGSTPRPTSRRPASS